MLMRKPIDRSNLIALLAAAALFLATIEYIIPKPLPFLRLGIANLPVLLALYLLDPKEILLLVSLKILTQGFIQGTLFSYVFLFSCAGGTASALVMIGLFKLFRKHVSLIGISAAGAFVSNAVQLLLAGLIMWGPGVFLIAPPFLLIGTISACILGFLAQVFYTRSRWIRQVQALPR
jgi:heptaprenyl diphosphate synthase